MIHTTDTITIRRYGRIDRTNDLGLLRRWWNPFPMGWFDTEAILSEIARGLKTGIDKRLTHEVAKQFLYNKILILEGLHLAIYNLIIVKPQNDQWNITKRKSTNLIEFIDLSEKLTGFRIKGAKDLSRLRKEINRLSDKFMERYREPEKERKNIQFTKFAYTLFEILEMDYDPNTTMSEFFNIIQRVDEKSKSLEVLKSKQRNGRN